MLLVVTERNETDRTRNNRKENSVSEISERNTKGN